MVGKHVVVTKRSDQRNRAWTAQLGGDSSYVIALTLSPAAAGMAIPRSYLLLSPYIHSLLLQASVAQYADVSTARCRPTIPTHQRRFNRNNADYEDYPPSVRASANHQPTRPVDKDKNEAELAVHIKKATSAEETAPSEYQRMARADE